MDWCSQVLCVNSICVYVSVVFCVSVRFLCDPRKVGYYIDVAATQHAWQWQQEQHCTISPLSFLSYSLSFCVPIHNKRKLQFSTYSRKKGTAGVGLDRTLLLKQHTQIFFFPRSSSCCVDPIKRKMFQQFSLVTQSVTNHPSKVWNWIDWSILASFITDRGRTSELKRQTQPDTSCKLNDFLAWILLEEY